MWGMREDLLQTFLITMKVSNDNLAFLVKLSKRMNVFNEMVKDLTITISKNKSNILE